MTAIGTRGRTRPKLRKRFTREVMKARPVISRTRENFLYDFFQGRAERAVRLVEPVV